MSRVPGLGLSRMLGSLVKFIGRCLGGRGKSAAQVDVAVPSGAAAVATAVAGYVKRLEPQSFFLAARLASVARLNVPAGRKPYSTRLPDCATAPVPSARIGAKRQRIADAGRCLRRPVQASRPTAKIIAFPARRQTANGTRSVVARAA